MLFSGSPINFMRKSATIQFKLTTKIRLWFSTQSQSQHSIDSNDQVRKGYFFNRETIRHSIRISPIELICELKHKQTLFICCARIWMKYSNYNEIKWPERECQCNANVLPPELSSRQPLPDWTINGRKHEINEIKINGWEWSASRICDWKKKTEYYTKTILITMNIHSNFPYFLSFRCLPHLIAHEKKTVFQNIKIKRKMNWTDETLKLWLYCYVCFCCAFLRSSHFSIFIVFLSECYAKRMGQSFGECLAFRHNANAHSLIQ